MFRLVESSSDWLFKNRSYIIPFILQRV